MPKKIIFDKYSKRSPDYHWQQVGRNIFRLNAFVLARYQQAVDLVPRNDKQKILDIGCGDGVLLSLIKGGQLFGVDPDQDSLDLAGKKIKAKLIKAKAEKLPFKNNFFDTVIATEIIEHLAKPESMLKEIMRVLKPGGRVIITTPVKPKIGLTDRLHHREYLPEELKSCIAGYFRSVKINTSHPLWLKNFYTFSFGKIGRWHLELGRWVTNAIVITTGWNPFKVLAGKPSQQIALARK